MMKFFIFSIMFCLVFQISLEISFQLKCPEKSFWKQRAQKQCPNKTNSYHCLFDGKSKQYVERCFKPYLYGNGLRAVWNLNLDAMKCLQDKFTPYPRWSNDGYSCQFIKSKCANEGQILVDDGTSGSDRSCRCDFTKGYAYVTSPQNPCKCNPRTDDCSCYIQFCPKNEILFPDYKCRAKGETDDISSFCKPLENKTFQEDQTTNSSIHSLKNVKNLGKRHKLITVILSVVIVVYIVTIVLMSCCLLPNFCPKSHLVSLSGGATTQCLTVTDDPVPSSADVSMTNISCCEYELSDPKKEQGVTIMYHQETEIVPVPYYQKTKQYDQLVDCFEKGSRHVILIGPPGAGKTQTAYQYCFKMKSKYSVVANLVASNDTTLLESLKELVRILCWPLALEQTEIENRKVSSLAQYLRDFLNQTSHKTCTYLILVDDICFNHNLREVIHFLNGVTNLKLLCTTYDSTLKTIYVDAISIDHDGMEESEYLQFFKKSKYFSDTPDGTISEIANKIGTLPLALNCARNFIETTGESVKSYLLHFNENKDTDTLDETVSYQNPGYKYGLLTSQTIPLNHIKTKISKTLWEVIMLLPFLEYNSISTHVLDACCYHLSRNIKLKANEIIRKCSKYSLCQLKERPGQHVSCRHDKLEQCYVQSFHTATILALTWMNRTSQDGKQLDNKRLNFLLKVFSFEIDTDIREESVLKRNLLFVNHAIKVLKKFKTKGKTSEWLYLTFLNYAVGKTLLREGKDLSLAHKYLMESRNLCLSMINEKSEFTQDECVNGANNQSKDFKEIIDKNIHRQNVILAFDAFKEKCTEDHVVEEFILNKRRSKTDRDALRLATGLSGLCKYFYLTKDDYKDLVDKNRAIAISDLKKTFVSELMVHILFDNGRSLHELYRVSGNMVVRNASHFEFSTCDEFSTLLEDLDIFRMRPLLVCLDNAISGKSYKRSTKECKMNENQIKEDIWNINNLIGKDKKDYFQFGIAKVSSSTYEHHLCMCLKFVLKNLTKQFHLTEESCRQKVFEKGQEVTEKILKKIEDNKDSEWLDTPFFYLKCAKMFELSKDEYCLKRSLRLFQQAIAMEEKTNQVIWTRNLWEAYYGNMCCLCKLNQKKEAANLYDRLKNQVKGESRNKLRKKLEMYLNT